MTVSATTAINQTATPKDTTSTGRTSLAENFNMFLTLLTTQMKNQDPTSPMDSNQFMSQLVQMTGVEQQLAGNDLLKQLVANTGSNLGSVVNLIGKEVRAATNQATLTGDQAKWGYSLNASAADVKMEVVDSRGVTVQTIAVSEADRKAGEHTFVWDGKDSSGAKLADGGVYTLKITAKDASGGAIPTSTFVQGVVTGVESQDGQGMVSLNGGRVSIALITSVNVPAATADTNTDTTDTTNPTDQTSDQAA
jgi:flagellar basal-body rod modification protein FlgD